MLLRIEYAGQISLRKKKNSNSTMGFLPPLMSKLRPTAIKDAASKMIRSENSVA